MDTITISKGIQALIDAHTRYTDESGSGFVERAVMETIHRDNKKARQTKGKDRQKKVSKAVKVSLNFHPVAKR